MSEIRIGEVAESESTGLLVDTIALFAVAQRRLALFQHLITCLPGPGPVT